MINDCLVSVKIAMKARVSSVALWLLTALLVIVWMAVQFSARQPATIALDVGLSVIRLALPLLVILLTQELFSREFERKLFLTSFTYPRSRGNWLLGRTLAIFLMSMGMLLLMSLLLAGLTTYAGSSYAQTTPVSLSTPYMITLGFIAADLLVAISISILLAVSATTPSFVLIGSIGFLIIARSYTPIIELLRNTPSVVSEFADPHLYQDSLGLIAFVLPDLGRLDVRMIALYDQIKFLPSDWLLLLTATMFYAAALFGLAIWVLNKREFS